MKARSEGYTHALVLRSYWEIFDYKDVPAIGKAKRTHNSAMRDLIREFGLKGVMAGASPCTLCERCAEVCPHPTERWSCLSAYCVDVKALAEKCGMVYFAPDGGISFFSVYWFTPETL